MTRLYDAGVPEPMVEGKQEAGLQQTSIEDILTDEEKWNLESLLQRLSTNIVDGILDKEDLTSITVISNALRKIHQYEKFEKTTSTTSLSFSNRTSKEPKLPNQIAEISSSTSTSSLHSIDRFIHNTVVEAWQKGDSEVTAHNLVNDILKNTVDHLTQDLRDGVLSREEVRDIGSRMASVVLGETLSDDSLVADDIVVPTLQKILHDSQEIDEELLDQTMASLLASYGQISRRSDSVVWQVLKDFVVHLLLQTKTAIEDNRVAAKEYLEKLRDSRCLPHHHEMDLPTEQELTEVMSLAASKLNGLERLSPVLCDLMKIVLSKGHHLLGRCSPDDHNCVPRITPSMVEQVGNTAVGLEVAFEVTATICEGLGREMTRESAFVNDLYWCLAPEVFLSLLSCWEEIDPATPRDTAAIQTCDCDLPQVPTVGELVILHTLHRVRSQSDDQCFRSSFLTSLALALVDVPSTVSVADILERDNTDCIKLPECVVNKISNLSERVHAGELDDVEIRKLLAVVLCAYIKNEVNNTGDPTTPGLTPTLEKNVVDDLLVMISSVVNRLLAQVQNEASGRTADNGLMGSSVPSYLVSDVLGKVAEESRSEIRRCSQMGVSSDDKSEAQLKDIIVVTSRFDGLQRDKTDLPSIADFTATVLSYTERQPVLISTPTRPDHSCHSDRAMMEEMIREELGTLAMHVVEVFSQLASTCFLSTAVSCPIERKIITFLNVLLSELRQALDTESVPLGLVYDFLHSLAGEICPHSIRGMSSKLDSVIKHAMTEIEFMKDKSIYYRRLVRKLRLLTVDKRQDDVVANMATSAHLLSLADVASLKTFVQTTLLSLLLTRKEAATDSRPVTVDGCTATDSADLETIEVELAAMQESLSPCKKESEISKCRSVRDKDDKPIIQVDPACVDQSDDSTLGRRTSKTEDRPLGEARTKEIRHEAAVLARTVIQTTLVCLGGTTPHVSVGSTLDIVESIVNNVKELEAYSKDSAEEEFTNLEATTAAYAHDLLKNVSKEFESDDGTVQADNNLTTSAMATIIIGKTFHNVEQDLQTGRHLLPGQHSSHSLSAQTTADDDHSCVDSASISNIKSAHLSSCLIHTLHAVKSELDLLNMPSVFASKSGSTNSQDSMDDSLTLKKATQVVNSIIRRLHHDTSTAKVEFFMDTGFRLKTHYLSSESEQDFCLQTSLQPKIVLETFSDVVKDMHAEHQFLNPPDVDISAKRMSSRERSSEPSLPYLMDTFILFTLKKIASFMAGDKQTIDYPLTVLSPEVVLVASSVHEMLLDIIAEMNMELERETGEEVKTETEPVLDDDVAGKNARKMIVLNVLEAELRKLLEKLADEPTASPVDDRDDGRSIDDATTEEVTVDWSDIPDVHSQQQQMAQADQKQVQHTVEHILHALEQGSVDKCLIDGLCRALHCNEAEVVGELSRAKMAVEGNDIDLCVSDLLSLTGDFRHAVSTTSTSTPAARQSHLTTAVREILTYFENTSNGTAGPAPVVPVEAVPVEAVPVEAVPVEAVPVEAVPVEAVPVEAVPVEAVPRFSSGEALSCDGRRANGANADGATTTAVEVAQQHRPDDNSVDQHGVRGPWPTSDRTDVTHVLSSAEVGGIPIDDRRKSSTAIQADLTTASTDGVSISGCSSNTCSSAPQSELRKNIDGRSPHHSSQDRVRSVRRVDVQYDCLQGTDRGDKGDGFRRASMTDSPSTSRTGSSIFPQSTSSEAFTSQELNQTCYDDTRTGNGLANVEPGDEHSFADVEQIVSSSQDATTDGSVSHRENDKQGNDNAVVNGYKPATAVPCSQPTIAHEFVDIDNGDPINNSHPVDDNGLQASSDDGSCVDSPDGSLPEDSEEKAVIAASLEDVLTTPDTVPESASDCSVRRDDGRARYSSQSSRSIDSNCSDSADWNRSAVRSMYANRPCLIDKVFQHSEAGRSNGIDKRTIYHEGMEDCIGTIKVDDNWLSGSHCADLDRSLSQQAIHNDSEIFTKSNHILSSKTTQGHTTAYPERLHITKYFNSAKNGIASRRLVRTDSRKNVKSCDQPTTNENNSKVYERSYSTNQTYHEKLERKKVKNKKVKPNGVVNVLSPYAHTMSVRRPEGIWSTENRKCPPLGSKLRISFKDNVSSTQRSIDNTSLAAKHLRGDSFPGESNLIHEERLPLLSSTSRESNPDSNSHKISDRIKYFPHPPVHARVDEVGSLTKTFKCVRFSLSGSKVSTTASSDGRQNDRQDDVHVRQGDGRSLPARDVKFSKELVTRSTQRRSAFPLLTSPHPPSKPNSGLHRKAVAGYRSQDKSTSTLGVLQAQVRTVNLLKRFHNRSSRNNDGSLATHNVPLPSIGTRRYNLC